MTNFKVTIPSRESRQLKATLFRLGINEMIISEVEGFAGAKAPQALRAAHGPKLKVEFTAANDRVEPILRAITGHRKCPHAEQQ